MSDEMKTTFTTERIAEQASGIITALNLATITYLRDHQLDVDAYWTSVGQQFAPSWAGRQGRPTKDIAQQVAFNIVSMGGTVQSLSGDDSQAEVVILNWPAEDSRTDYKLDQADIDPFWNIWQPVAEYLGHDFAWERQGDEVTLTFSRRSNE